ncbi:MAG: ABC transporter permease [Phycisphaerales bacterium]
MRSPMRKVLDVAVREYRSTTLTKAFLFGVVLFPLIVYAIIAVAAPLFDSPEKRLEGAVAVLDRTTEERPIEEAIRASFNPERMQAEFDARIAAIEAEIDKRITLTPEQRAIAISQMKRRLPGGPTDVDVRRLEAADNLEPAKQEVREGALLAVVDVGPEALDASGQYSIFTPPDLASELSSKLRREVERAIVDTRLRTADYDPQTVRSLLASPSANQVTITEEGETEKSAEFAQFIVPAAFMMLLWIASFSGGQYLLTTTIEEKSSRVMEVLLSAVSPMQLMTGKILGQLAVGVTIIAIYVGLGLLAADRFGFLSLVPIEKIGWLAVYFLMAFFLIGAMMAAIGSAVNEMREAQSFMSVIMIMFMIPMFLFVPIIEGPNSTFATVASFIPPLTPFVMILRLGQTTEAIPAWQIGLSMVVGFAAVFGSIWAAAKIFRVGVLMYGKPPTPATLIKWIRYA